MSVSVGALTAQDRYDIRDEARYMALRGGAVSEAAHAMVEALMAGTVLPSLPTSQKRPSSLPKLATATGAIVADLIAAEALGRWTRRSLDDHSFTSLPVSRRMFHKVREALEAAGYLISIPAWFDRSPSNIVARGGQTCFKATSALLSLAETAGVGMQGWTDHFTAGRPNPSADAPLIVLKAKSRRGEDGKRIPGRMLPPTYQILGCRIFGIAWRGSTPISRPSASRVSPLRV